MELSSLEAQNRSSFGHDQEENDKEEEVGQPEKTTTLT